MSKSTSDKPTSILHRGGLHREIGKSYAPLLLSKEYQSLKMTHKQRATHLYGEWLITDESETMQIQRPVFDPIKVLDHGLVRLVDSMGNDLSIVRNARVSYDAEWRNPDINDPTKPGDEKLINYLMKNHHTSPFESVFFTFEIKAPIFVIRQWHRHRTMAYSEVSARYTELPETFYVPQLDQITTQSTTNKQMRTKQQHHDALFLRTIIESSCSRSFEHYRMLLEMGTPRELARTILPLGTYSHMFASVSLHNLFNFLRLRIHEHSQYEIRVYADAMLKLIEPIVPVAVAAFRQHNPTLFPEG